MTETTNEPTEQPRQVDAVVALTETFAMIVSSMLDLMPPYPLQPGDVMKQQELDRSQHVLAMGMHQLHSLLAAMGSSMVAGPPAASSPVPAAQKSSIIIPGQV